MKENIDIVERTFEFATNIVKLAFHLDERSSVARVLSKQILRSGTSVGATIEEGQSAQSKLNFIRKYSIALKEARETIYWLRLLEVANIISEQKIKPIKQESEEICRIIAKIIINSKKNPR